MQYHFNKEYASFVNLYKDSLSLFGLDVSLPLSQQDCSIDDSKATWYEYFMDKSEATLKNYLIASEKHLADNPDFLKNNKKLVDNKMDEIKLLAEAENKKLSDYIKVTYGENVTKNDVKTVCELEVIYSKYKDEYMDGFDVTDGFIEKQFKNNSKLFTVADILKFEIVGVDKETAKKRIEKFQKVDSEKEFLELVEKYTQEDCKAQKIKDSKIQKQIKNAKKNAKQTGVYYNEVYKELNWVFGGGRRNGDVNFFEYKVGDKSSYSVVYIISTPSEELYKETSFRNISFNKETYDDAKKTAKVVLKDLKDNRMREDSFKYNARKYSTDTITSARGGLYEDQTLETLPVHLEKLGEWIFNPKRKLGDTAIIENGETYNLLYIDSQGDEIWKIKTKENYLENSFQKNLNSLKEKIELTVNSNLIYSIDDVSPIIK